jgi:hypothetical protein
MGYYNITILPSAHQDMREARAWYRQHTEDLPKRLMQQIRLGIAKIRATPFAYAIRYQEVHIANINIFPYAIHYLIVEDTVVVIGVFHTAINPEKWKYRA